MKHILYYLNMIIISSVVLVSSLTATEHQTQLKTLAILPFETISADNIDYIQAGVSKMFQSRMTWQDRVTVVSIARTQEQLDKIKNNDKNKQIQALAASTKADFVITGSITQFSNAFSIDSRIYDIKNKRFLSFSEQSDKLSDIIIKVDQIAAKINKKVFNRQTVSYDKLVSNEKEKFEQLKRQNPEKLMPAMPKEPGDKKPIWKFWEYL